LQPWKVDPARTKNGSLGSLFFLAKINGFALQRATCNDRPETWALPFQSVMCEKTL
jgi:hypothetical protein